MLTGDAQSRVPSFSARPGSCQEVEYSLWLLSGLHDLIMRSITQEASDDCRALKRCNSMQYS